MRLRWLPSVVALVVCLVQALPASAQDGGPADSAQRQQARKELARFASFIGAVWESEGDVPGAGRYTAERTWTWVLDSAFIRVDQTMRFASGEPISETMYIGWDPIESRMHVWGFASDGSYSDGYEVKGEDPRRWIAEGRTFGTRSQEWRITTFQFQDDAFSILIEVRSGSEFTPALTMAFHRKR
jgi:hypothetical protein